MLEALRTRTMQGPCQFTLLVPSTPHGLGWAADMHGGGDEAEQHRAGFLQELRDEGLNVSDAKVGDPDPLAAIQDECNFHEYDELIVSTLPLHISKWLKVDLPRKARARRASRQARGGELLLMDLEETRRRPVIERTCAECGTAHRRDQPRWTGGLPLQRARGRGGPG